MRVFSAQQVRRTVASVPARGTVQLFLARGCFLVSGYIISVILARGLGPAEFGVYGVLMSVLVWIETIGSAGVPSATTRLIPQYQEQAAAVDQSAKMLLVLWSVVLFALGWILAPTVMDILHLPQGVTLFRLAILDLPFSGLYFAYQGMLGGHRRYTLLSTGMIAYSLTKVGGLLVLYGLGLSVAGALLVNVLATVGALVYLVSQVPPTMVWPTRALMREIIHIAVPTGLYLVFSQILLNLHLWFLQSLGTGSDATVGIYVAALNLARMLSIVPSVLSGILFSSLSWALARHNEALAQHYIQNASRFAAIVLFPLCTMLAVHAAPLMGLLYTDMYASGGIFLALQLAAFGCKAFFDLYMHGLMAAGKYYLAAGFLLTLLPLGVLGNLVLIPQHGALGAALALLAIILLGTLIAAVWAYQRFGALIKKASLIRITAATVLTAWLSTQISLNRFGLLLEFAGFLVVYGLLLSLLKELCWDDLKAFALWEKPGS
jgi:O-antigen/teichoic acid export membrane protein